MVPETTGAWTTELADLRLLVDEQTRLVEEQAKLVKALHARFAAADAPPLEASTISTTTTLSKLTKGNTTFPPPTLVETPVAVSDEQLHCIAKPTSPLSVDPAVDLALTPSHPHREADHDDQVDFVHIIVDYMEEQHQEVVPNSQNELAVALPSSGSDALNTSAATTTGIKPTHATAAAIDSVPSDANLDVPINCSMECTSHAVNALVPVAAYGFTKFYCSPNDTVAMTPITPLGLMKDDAALPPASTTAAPIAVLGTPHHITFLSNTNPVGGLRLSNPEQLEPVVPSILFNLPIECPADVYLIIPESDTNMDVAATGSMKCHHQLHFEQECILHTSCSTNCMIQLHVFGSMENMCRKLPWSPPPWKLADKKAPSIVLVVMSTITREFVGYIACAAARVSPSCMSGTGCNMTALVLGTAVSIFNQNFVGHDATVVLLWQPWPPPFTNLHDSAKSRPVPWPDFISWSLKPPRPPPSYKSFVVMHSCMLCVPIFPEFYCTVAIGQAMFLGLIRIYMQLGLSNLVAQSMDAMLDYFVGTREVLCCETNGSALILFVTTCSNALKIFKIWADLRGWNAKDNVCFLLKYLAAVCWTQIILLLQHKCGVKLLFKQITINCVVERSSSWISFHMDLLWLWTGTILMELLEGVPVISMSNETKNASPRHKIIVAEHPVAQLKSWPFFRCIAAIGLEFIEEQQQRCVADITEIVLWSHIYIQRSGRVVVSMQSPCLHSNALKFILVDFPSIFMIIKSGQCNCYNKKRMGTAHFIDNSKSKQELQYCLVSMSCTS